MSFTALNMFDFLHAKCDKHVPSSLDEEVN